jgi:hypothetical protein
MAVLEKIEEKLLRRLDELIEKGKAVLDTTKPNSPRVHGPEYVDIIIFGEWKSSCLNLLSTLPLTNNHFYTEFLEKVMSNNNPVTQYGIGVLLGLKNSIANGDLQSPISFIQTEIFSDFLEMAEHIFEQGHKDPPVMLAGAVLEDSLRKICIKNKITVPADSNIASLNQLLLQKPVYNKIVFKDVDKWKAIRDFADHANFDQYDRDRVKDMLEGVRKFIGEYLG